VPVEDDPCPSCGHIFQVERMDFDETFAMYSLRFSVSSATDQVRVGLPRCRAPAETLPRMIPRRELTLSRPVFTRRNLSL
jgi:hypothetical protein